MSIVVASRGCLYIVIRRLSPRRSRIRFESKARQVSVDCGHCDDTICQNSILLQTVWRPNFKMEQAGLLTGVIRNL